MDELIACCGLDCNQCDARRATLHNDDALRAKTARLWCELNHTDMVRPEHINCLGCRVEGVKTVFCSTMCDIRRCCQSKGFDTCRDCDQKRDCAKLSSLTSSNPDALRRIQD